jgi:integrase
VFTSDQERTFLKACDAWQFPLFLTLLVTGLRSGELAHLLLPDDLDLDAMYLWREDRKVARVRSADN